MALISEEYLRLNTEKHAASAAFGTSGEKWAKQVISLALQTGAKTVLDYGCGKGTLKTKVDRFVFSGIGGAARERPFEVLEYDPAIPGKEEKPEHADAVVCTDVLEHIEPECLDAVLDDIRDIARDAVLLVVGTHPANKTLPDGRNAHLIVEPLDWWMPKFEERWNIEATAERQGHFSVFGMRK